MNLQKLDKSLQILLYTIAIKIAWDVVSSILGLTIAVLGAIKG